MKNNEYLASLLCPKSIAVVGASREKDKIGRIILDNILKGGFGGKVYPVNPNASKIAGLKCYTQVSQISQSIDLAIVAVPAQFVLDVVKDCAGAKVKAIVIITAGFSEVGQEGLELEFQIKKIVEGQKIQLLGPNCLGFLNSSAKLNATFAKSVPHKGKIAFISQSGAIGTAALDWAEKQGISFSHFVSIGNKASLNENDFLSYFVTQEDVKLVALYLEDFVDGQEFMKVASKSNKPIVILKPGKSKEAQKALGSHTGSLAQSDIVISSALSQCGTVRVDSIEELFNCFKIFASGKSLEGRDIAIITNAGGPGVMTTDEVELAGLNLAKLESKTEKMLRLILPPAANTKNPIDVLGDAKADRYKASLELVGDDKNVNGIIVLLTPQVMTEVELTAEAIISYARKNKKPITASFLGGKIVQKGKEILEGNGIPTFDFPGDAIKALSYLRRFEQSTGRRGREVTIKIPHMATFKVGEILSKAKGVLDSQTAEKILDEYKIPVIPSYFPTDIASARRFAAKLGYPVALKLIHPKLLHKTEKSAVKLNLDSEGTMGAAYEELVSLANSLKLEGFKIEEQPFISGALELIIGVKRDADQYAKVGKENLIRKRGFGHSLLFGRGGIYTEVYKDFGLRLIPLNNGDDEDLISETKVGKILGGVRGKGYNVDKIKEILLRLSLLVTDFPQISEIDINPLFAKGKDVWAVDVKMIV